MTEDMRDAYWTYSSVRDDDDPRPCRLCDLCFKPCPSEHIHLQMHPAHDGRPFGSGSTRGFCSEGCAMSYVVSRDLVPAEYVLEEPRP